MDEQNEEARIRSVRAGIYHYIRTTIMQLTEALIELVESPKHEFYSCERLGLFSGEPVRDNRDMVPSAPGIYLVSLKLRCVLEPGQQFLYVGISENLKSRLFDDHLHGSCTNSTFRRALNEESVHASFEDRPDTVSEQVISDYVKDKCEFRFKQCDLLEARQLEHFAIAVFDPLLNERRRALRDADPDLWKLLDRLARRLP